MRVEITEENFAALIDALDDFDTYESQLADLLGCGYIEPMGDLAGAVIGFLNRCFEIDYDYGDIDYYIYELDFGRRYKPGVITDADGHDVPMRNAHDLYRALQDLPGEKEIGTKEE